jgi:hypothetical protein
MKFILLAYGNEAESAKLTESQMRELGDKCNAYDAELNATGRVTMSGSLGGSKRMRLERGKLRVTDGPFLETKELVGGFVIIEAENFDEAVQIAMLHPAARMGEELGWGIELRPLDRCVLKDYATKG